MQGLPADMTALEAKLEATIKHMLSTHRAEQVREASGSLWDDSLAFLLMPALAAFERDAIWGEHGIAMQANALCV